MPCPYLICAILYLWGGLEAHPTKISIKIGAQVKCATNYKALPNAAQAFFNHAIAAASSTGSSFSTTEA